MENSRITAKNKQKFINYDNENYTLHDFRIVDGRTHTNLIFDVVVPQDDKVDAIKLKEEIRAKVKEKSPDYHVVCQIEKSYV